MSEKRGLEKKAIENLFLPLTKINAIVSIFIYGSAVKKGPEKGHDIDVLVLYDEEKAEKIDLQKADFFIDLIKARAEKQGLILHFQPPKPLSLWWKLINRAEPWAISALRYSIIIYDPRGYIALLKKLLEEGKIYSLDEKAEMLMSRAVEKFYFGIRAKMLEAPVLLLEAMTAIGRIMLSYYGIYTTSANETVAMLKRHNKKINLGERDIELYEELLKMNEKIAKGTLSEFRPSEMDVWSSRVKELIGKSEALLLELEQKRKDKEIRDAFDYMISLCEKALKIKIRNIPEKNEDKLRLFKKYFVKTKQILPEQYKPLEEIYQYIKKKKSIEPKYFDITYLRALEAGIDKLLVEKK